MILHDRARRYRIALGRCCFGPHLSLFAAALPTSQHLHTRFLPCFGDQPYLASSASRRPTAHPIFSLPTLSSRMTSRKAKFKDGAAVVIGVAEGTMPVDVEDDDEEDDEDDDEAADRCLTAILTMEPAYPNATPVWRTGSLVSAPNRYCVCSPPSCDATEHSRLSLSFLPSGLCLSRRGSGGSDPAPC